MSTPKEQYESMLDELDSDSKLALIDHVPFARLLEEVDPVAYRCGMSDYQASCDECGDEFWADDPDEPAVCAECKVLECAECTEPAAEGETLCEDCTTRKRIEDATTDEEA
jgi:hypothetical protein